MTKEEAFYVYLFRDVDGTPIYVGKGTGRRATSHITPSGKKISNGRLQRLIDKRAEKGLLLEPQIIAFGTEDNMLMVEVALINFFGRADKGLGTLFNHTDGGDGVSNPSEEVRKKQADAMYRRHGGERRFVFENEKTGERFEGNCAEFSKHLGLKTSTHVNRLVKENSDLNSIKGWTVEGSGFVAREYMTSFEFIHIGTKERFTGTQAELMRHTNMSAGSASAIVLRKVNHALGWCLKDIAHQFPRVKKAPSGYWQTPEEVWNNNQTPKSIVAWALADEILKTYETIRQLKPDAGAMAVIRSMDIVEFTTERAVGTVIRYFSDWSIKPEDLPIWKNFAQNYKSKNVLPVNKFRGRLVDGRQKENPDYAARKQKVWKLTQEGIGPQKIAERLNISRATVQKIKRRLNVDAKEK